MQHSYHCHPRLGTGMHGPMVGNQRLHVRQGEVDATCGYHCVLMALMLFAGDVIALIEGWQAQALAAGSNLLRIGSAIFGQRAAKTP